MVAGIIEHKKEEIAVLCRNYRIRRLWLFGSAATIAFDPEKSDLDFLVDLGEHSNDYASRFFSLQRALAELTQHNVDLVSVGGLGSEDDWFRKEIEATRVTIYDAGQDQLVA